MVSISKVKTKISNVIDTYGNDITIKSVGDVTYDDWGEPVSSGQVSVDTLGVTDEFNASSSLGSKMTRIEGSDMVLLIKADEDISIKHTIVIDSIEYSVINVKKLKVSNIEVAYELQLASK